MVALKWFSFSPSPIVQPLYTFSLSSTSLSSVFIYCAISIITVVLSFLHDNYKSWSVYRGRKKEAAKNNGVNHDISFFSIHPIIHPSISCTHSSSFFLSLFLLKLYILDTSLRVSIFLLFLHPPGSVNLNYSLCSVSPL